jgi:hypothetical protein
MVLLLCSTWKRGRGFHENSANSERFQRVLAFQLRLSLVTQRGKTLERQRLREQNHPEFSKYGSGGELMKISQVVSTGARVLAVCLLFTLCLIAGTMASGMNRAGQNAPASSPASSASAVTQSNPVSTPAAVETPPGIFVSFCIYCLCAGTAISLMILRSRWSGWKLSLAMFVAVYGFSCIVNAVDAEAFLNGKFFPELIRSWLPQSAITAALCTPLSVLILGKWGTDNRHSRRRAGLAFRPRFGRPLSSF